MTTKKSFVRTALVAAISSALILPVFSVASPVSAKKAPPKPAISKTLSSTFLVNGKAPVLGLTVSGFENKTVLVSIGVTASREGNFFGGNGQQIPPAAYLFSDPTSSPAKDVTWGFQSDPRTQQTTNDGLGLSTLQFHGTQTQVNALLKSHLFVNANLATQSVSVTAMATEYKEGVIYSPVTGHFYKFVQPMREKVVVNSVGAAAEMEVDDKFTWSKAKAAAEASSEYGVSGYLATITSSAENVFVTTRITPDGKNFARNVWLGAAVTDTNYEWKWAAGPDAGVAFYKGCETWNPARRTGTELGFAAFSAAEPNNWASSSDKCSTTTITEGCLLTNNKDESSLGGWNDYGCDLTRTQDKVGGYVVEYGDKTVGGNFTGVYTSTSTLNRAVPSTRINLLQTLAVQFGKIKSAIKPAGKKKASTFTFKLRVLEPGLYSISVFSKAKGGYEGLRIREGSTVNGVPLDGKQFRLKKSSLLPNFKINLRSGKSGTGKPEFRLYKWTEVSKGAYTFVRQDIPSNWNIALKAS